jgi:hypothetical protein
MPVNINFQPPSKFRSRVAGEAKQSPSFPNFVISVTVTTDDRTEAKQKKKANVTVDGWLISEARLSVAHAAAKWDETDESDPRVLMTVIGSDPPAAPP